MYEKIPALINKSETIGHIGKIENVVGMSMEASGGRSSIGDIVMIYNEEQNRQMPAEVVGFKSAQSACGRFFERQDYQCFGRAYGWWRRVFF